MGSEARALKAERAEKKKQNALLSPEPLQQTFFSELAEGESSDASDLDMDFRCVCVGVRVRGQCVSNARVGERE